ncbi:hypothetical protein IEQ34_015048 [Dendrobium chrysotoxum]|uniref:Secreted protein n=1 Tax=Dendrobium chrysotoxum TaxID=161865 RepID=A0AAV7GKU0_DENCH|nr:hypothetical protein IEQ34_015048 [Dendrobium chrysotoxum]
MFELRSRISSNPHLWMARLLIGLSLWLHLGQAKRSHPFWPRTIQVCDLFIEEWLTYEDGNIEANERVSILVILCIIIEGDIIRIIRDEL